MKDDKRPAPNAAILARPPLRADHLRAGAPARNHLGDQFRRVLKVAVHDDRRVRSRRRQSGGYRRLLAEVSRQVDQRKARILPVMLEHDRERTVGASVVDVDDPRVEIGSPASTRAGG